MGLKESKLYFLNGIAMIIVFFLSRNVMGICEHPPPPLPPLSPRLLPFFSPCLPRSGVLALLALVKS